MVPVPSVLGEEGRVARVFKGTGVPGSVGMFLECKMFFLGCRGVHRC